MDTETEEPNKNNMKRTDESKVKVRVRLKD